MHTKYEPVAHEAHLAEFWEKKGYFRADPNSTEKPFSIILPPPNANANLHLGHAMYVYEDIMIRAAKLGGANTLWLPGADHAGFETQFVFEKHLKSQGKSRFDYTNEQLFQMIWDFVMDNRKNMEDQLRMMGFSLDWPMAKFTMDEDIVSEVYATFEKLHDQGLLYRDTKLVNYCTFCGTSFSDLEITYKERNTPFYYLKYGPFTLGTVRPETKFGDTAIAVHPSDSRYKKWIGKELKVDGLIGEFTLKVVADEAVDPKFGTGAVKVTPAHDFTDFEIAKRHGLPLKQVIGYDGKLTSLAGPYEGLYVKQARRKVVEDLLKIGMIDRIDEEYVHRVATCYKCANVIEPLPKEQWFVKIRPLAERAKAEIQKGSIKIYPKRFTQVLIDWLDRFHDWNISRQLVWGIRIPAYKCMSSTSVGNADPWFVSATPPEVCKICGTCVFEQDSDTFDTWFSSAQWPFATLAALTKKTKKDYLSTFYPTTVMETGYDILPWWVARMVMIGLFATDEVPFKNVYLHGMVRDRKGQKMSKSKGNVINPVDMLNKYGADAIRAALVFQSKAGGDVNFSEEKVVAMRNFANKVWNIGRFILTSRPGSDGGITEGAKTHKIISRMEMETKECIKKVGTLHKKFEFGAAFDELYEYIWHGFADIYIEELKKFILGGDKSAHAALEGVYGQLLRHLHPFMPFVTEAVWKNLYGENASLLDPIKK